MKLSGHINDKGELKLPEKQLLVEWLKTNPNKSIELEIKVRRKKRSNDQNAYMWGVVIPMVCTALRNLGHDVDEEETHEFLKSKFNSKKLANENGEFIDLPTSTTKLTTVEMMDYIASIQMWAAEFLGIVIPDPNQQLMIVTGDTVNDTNLLIVEKGA